jgi:hypothetical protein
MDNDVFEKYQEKSIFFPLSNFVETDLCYDWFTVFFSNVSIQWRQFHNFLIVSEATNKIDLKLC